MSTDMLIIYGCCVIFNSLNKQQPNNYMTKYAESLLLADTPAYLETMVNV